MKYWGYPGFRPMQENIINSVLDGKDSLGLLPTGGGKSICFQVPAMAMDGICIVITPLIALMKDQVENLNKKGIKAVAIYSGMHRNAIDIALSNCIYSDVKFLYLSPERLETDMFRERLKKMNVCLLAVDEAHCISQWGYDFRPPYLRINDTRKYLPGVPVLALTATATPEVVIDIQDKLGFKEKNVFQKSFERKNLSYVVLHEEDKLRKLLIILNNVKGTAIIYVRNRRKTKEISDFLNKKKIICDYYHAGLDPKIRDKKQSEWMKGKKRVIVSTNAFGMGIDKPNVRLVIHLDLTDSIEAYFQEAGRAGRDEKKSYAVLLYQDSDVLDAKHRLESSYPKLDLIKNIYQALGNYFQLAVGSGKDMSFDFDIVEFCENYKFSPLLVFNSLTFLEKEGYLILSNALYQPSLLYFNVNKDDLYRFQVRNASYDVFIKLLLRSYSGLLNDFVKIYETEIAKRANVKKEAVNRYLNNLQKLGLLTYIPQKNKPQVVFCKERIDKKELYISKENYKDRKVAAEKRLEAVINYTNSITKCRSLALLEYFGETDSKRCGVCDVCLQRNKMELSEFEFDIILEKIKPLLQKKACSLQEIADFVKRVNDDKIIKVVRFLLDNDKVRYDKNKKIKWR